MSQKEIIEILQKEGDLPTKDISMKLHINKSSVWKSCKSLLKYGEIEFEIRQESKAVKKIYWRIKNDKEN